MYEVWVHCIIFPAAGNKHCHRTACYVLPLSRAICFATDRLLHAIACGMMRVPWCCLFSIQRHQSLLTAVQIVVLTVRTLQRSVPKVFRRKTYKNYVFDEDVQQYCQQALTAPRAGVWGIGTAGRCLSKSLAEGQYMAQGCKNLVIAAAPKASCCPQPAWF